MDEPRISEVAREEDSDSDHAAGVGNAAASSVVMSLRLSMREWMIKMEENDGEANHGNS
jgi:hypothetical protein